MKNKKEVGIILGVSALIVILGVILFLFLTKKKTYTVSFNTNGGREIKSIKVKQNESIGTLPKAEKEGYNFLYWVIDGTIIREDYKVEKDITIEARYEIKVDNVKTYIITFDTDGGSEIPSQEVKENEKIKYPGEPKKDGYIFKMWVYDEEAIDFSKPITKDMTLKAEYEKITTSTTTTVKPTTTTTKKVATTVKPTTTARVTTTMKVTPTTATSKPITTTKSQFKELNCTYDGELIPGAEYVNGQYTYMYQYYYYEINNSKRISKIDEDGWSVRLSDKTSTKPVTSQLCASINGKPITAMTYMFYNSKATSIDLSSFNTSKVTDMSGMFQESAATEIKGLNNFDTSKVTDMTAMFQENAAKKLDLSSFDTSSVTSMYWMFLNSAATTLDLSSFDTSSVTSMNGMFSGSAATEIKGLNNFDTSKVTDMSAMFQESAAKKLDLSSFDTSSVTSMYWMFLGSYATTLDLSSFDTSNVENMYGMFWESKTKSIIGLNGFNTTKVEYMSRMFEESAATILDLSSFDTSKVTDMSNMFLESAATTGYARTQADADRFNNVARSLSNGTNPITGIPDSLVFVVKQG